MGKSIQADIINKQGTRMLTAKKIHVRDGSIVVDGNIMTSMPGQFYLTPLNLYKMTKLVNFEVIKAAVGMYFQGRKEFKAELAAEQAAEQEKAAAASAQA